MSNYTKFKELGLCIRCGDNRWNGKTRCEKHHKEHLQYQIKAKNKAVAKGLCRHCLVAPVQEKKSMCSPCLDSHKIKEKNRYLNERILCVNAYGGKCNCCGISVEKYLQLDHINNDGGTHRIEVFGTDSKGSMYRWAIKNSFPVTLQLLCANCHQAKTSGRSCTEEDHAHVSLQYHKF